MNMDHHAYAPLTSARVTIASILLTTMLVQSLPLLPYGHYTMRDLSRRFSPSSSSSSSSASSSSPSESSGPSAASLKDEMADLDGLSPQDAYLLALSLSLEKGDSGSAKALHNRASAPFNSNIYEKRPSKRFDFGFLGMDTYSDVLQNAMASKGAGRGSGRRSIVDRMERQG